MKRQRRFFRGDRCLKKEKKDIGLMAGLLWAMKKKTPGIVVLNVSERRVH